MPEREWTPAQRAGITTTGRGLLLSAAAGSGKTAVLAERCAYLVCDAPGACEIDEILVVAFNEAAALEMRGRIQERLRSRLALNPSKRFEKQVALAERAAISTLHSFCHRLLRQHFHRVGLDPNFTVIDADEASLLRHDLVRELFGRRYEADDAGEFQAFVDHYGNGDDENLVGQVLHIHGLLTSVIDPARWRADAIARLTEAAERPLEESKLGQAFLQSVRDNLQQLSDAIAAAIKTIQPMGSFGAYLKLLDEWQQVANSWRRLLDEHGLDALASEACSIDDTLSERLPAFKSGLAGKERAKDLMDVIKKHLREGFCRHAGRFSAEGWRQTVAQTLPAARVLLQLVADFDVDYAAAKSARHGVDFADLERFALQILSADPAAPGAAPSDVAHTLHRRYKHVLVDEYQDINEVQDAILRLASRESDGPGAESNLFCVGDVKQSIYRFRLAEPRRFLQRYEAYRSGVAEPAGEVIDLQNNFRSRAPLLDALNAIFRRLMTRASAELDYDASQELRPGAKYPPPADRQFFGKPLELHVVPARLSAEVDENADDKEQDEYEASLVARRIHELLGRDGKPPMQVMENAGGQMAPRDIRLGDIVVLLRAKKFTADHYANVLRRWNIPAHSDSGTGFFESTEIRDLLALLAVLDNQRQDIALAAVLRSPIAQPAVSEDDLASVRLAYVGGKPLVPFYEAVIRYAAEQANGLAARLKAILERIARWRQAINSRPVAEVLRSIYDDTGLLAYYTGVPDGDQRAANLEELYRRAAQFDTFARQGLSRFLRFLDNLQRDSDIGQPSLDPQGSDVVRIMTIHQSKGLEFPVVFLPNLGRKFNRSDERGAILADRRAHLALATVEEARQLRYPSMASLVLRDTINAQTTAEEIRVLYVALTRAREHLILIGSLKPESAEQITDLWKAWQGPMPASNLRGANSFIEWLLPLAAMEPAAIEVSLRTVEEMQSLADAPRQTQADELAPFARFDRAAVPDMPHPAAQAILQRIRFVYPYERYTTAPAARSVTSVTKGIVVPIAGTLGTPPRNPASALDLPAFLAAEVQPKATDIGSSTHVVLEHFDFADAADAAAVQGQLDSLVGRKILTQPQALQVDQKAILWFLQSDLGQLLRKFPDRLLRELPMFVPQPADGSDDPNDQIMLRGRLDALLNLPDGSVLIDYKTDRVNGPALEDRARFYGAQLQAYRSGMATITGKPVREAHLVFLHPRQIIPVA